MKIYKLVRTNAHREQMQYSDVPADTLAVAVEGEPLELKLSPEQVKELGSYPYNIKLVAQDV